MTAPSLAVLLELLGSHRAAQTESLKPAAAITSGSVMNGPTPIISSMLKRTAERRPMRRSSVAEGAGVGEGKDMSRRRSPDCTLA